MRRIVPFVVIASLLVAVPLSARAQSDPLVPFAAFGSSLRAAAATAPGHIALEVKDLTTGYSSGINATHTMPAASTIKIPIMVEVFRQMQLANFDFNRRVALLPQDKDYGSGTICDSPVGTTYPVSQLLSSMIDVSDNTAANMLIRLVGRHDINATMAQLGAPSTHLYDSIHTSGWNIRNTLRTSPADMVSI
nr:class A beta-lactamase-related serine hydrolase [Candidatus Eremiobacteraeota bacterium]